MLRGLVKPSKLTCRALFSSSGLTISGVDNNIRFWFERFHLDGRHLLFDVLPIIYSCEGVRGEGVRVWRSECVQQYLRSSV